MKHHPFKSVLFVGLVVAFMLGAAASASAWSEGSPDPGGLGTHDWILATANGLAGVDGWIDMNVAQPMSDYPDTVLQDNTNHIYDNWGAMRFTYAPSYVQAHYDAAVAALRLGDVAEASREAALMAHYYDDLWNPWHTAYEFDNLLTQALYHSLYEDNVLGHEPASVTLDHNLSRVTSAGAHAIAAATFSRDYYSTLANAYTSGAGYAGANVDAATKEMLRRAANGLADLIFSIKADAGPVNAPPVPIAAATPTTGTEPLMVAFDASGSTDADGAIVGYLWDFGDGTTSDAAASTHTYAAGIYTVTLTVIDNLSATGSTQLSISALPAPTGVMRVQDITLAASTAKSSTTLRGRVLITDVRRAAVSGATVTVSWNGGATGTATAKTNRDGWASFSKSVRNLNGTVELRVENVSKAGLRYHPAYNIVTSASWPS